MAPKSSEKEDMLNALVKHLLSMLVYVKCSFVLFCNSLPRPFMCICDSPYTRMQSKRIFSAMLDDIIFDVALQAHHEVLKGKSICQVCQTRYVSHEKMLRSFGLIMRMSDVVPVRLRYTSVRRDDDGY